jgi:hypothetical protein
MTWWVGSENGSLTDVLYCINAELVGGVVDLKNSKIVLT